MNSSAPSYVTNKVADFAVGRMAGLAGRKFADVALDKALPAIKTMNTRKLVTLAAIGGIGFLVFRALNRDVQEA
ncbi:MAG: hypothetical protein M3Q07_05090 [Pseudobdellovibrionaceae bacterium]|nr:hypothetical protein [Pseudobdellovibrionaceae bacterium]